MSYEPDPTFGQQLDDQIGALLDAAAEEGANVLSENLKAGGRTGRKYPRLPRRSSAPGEYPQEQSGTLRRGVGSARDGSTAQVIIVDDLGKLLGLEFSPPSKNPNQPGTPKRHSGGRAPMWMTMTDPRTRDRMAAAMEAKASS